MLSSAPPPSTQPGAMFNAPPGPPPQASGPPPSAPNITLRIILSKEEVTYLFGFNGMLLGQLRQQTAANIQLTDPLVGVADQVLTINGSLEVIMKAFSLVCRKLWDFVQSVSGAQRPLVLRLAVPMSQCGPIIGKQGAKVREIRDLTGSQIQVSQEKLPDSTERCIEVSGPGEACLQCTYHICSILQDSPLRTEVIPYLPKPAGGGMGVVPGVPPPAGGVSGGGGDGFQPVFLCGEKAFVIDGQIARPAPPELLKRELAQTSLGDMAESLASLNGAGFGHQQPQQPAMPNHMNPLALMQAISTSQRQQQPGGGAAAAGQTPLLTSRQMSINADLIQFIVGPTGNKLTEIRRISGAQLHISDDSPQNGDRIVTISGTEDSILLAQFLIQSNIDMAMKQGADLHSSSSSSQQQQQQHGNNGYDQQQHGGNNDPRLRNRQQQDQQHNNFDRSRSGSYDNGSRSDSLGRDGGSNNAQAQQSDNRGSNFRDPRARNNQRRNNGNNGPNLRR